MPAAKATNAKGADAAKAKAAADTEPVHDDQDTTVEPPKKAQQCATTCETLADLKARVDSRRSWSELVAPFPEDWIERLPKPLRRDDQDKGRCEPGSRYTADGHVCNGWHSRSVHLDYIGHAGITDRLNTVLGPGGWEFQPYAETDNGLPWMANGQPFFAKLTVHVGGVDGPPETVTVWDLAENYKSLQEAYGDALRRCAMRLGIGTYLWSKSEQALNKARGIDPQAEPDPEPERRADDGPHMTSDQHRLRGVLGELDADQATNLQTWWGNSGLPGLYELDAAGVAMVEQHIRDAILPDPHAAR